MLAKQFVEKEAYLKLLLGKYADQRLTETDNLKNKFRNDQETLDRLKEDGKLDEPGHRDGRKTVAVEEANALRDLGLSIDKAHKEEEAQLRQDLDKKHADEQIAFKQGQVENHARLRAELLGDAEAAEERKLDAKAAKHFTDLKKAEQ